MAEWIRDVIDIGSNVYHANIISHTIARGLQYQHALCFNCGKFGHLQQNYKQGLSKGKDFPKYKSERRSRHVQAMCQHLPLD